MTPATKYAERVGREVTRTFQRLGIKDSGESPESVGRRLAMSEQAENIWEGQFGPLLTSADARTMMGDISREALAKRVRTGKVLRLKDGRGRTRYPSWQFDPAEAKAYPAMIEIIKMFRDRGADEWEIASFCTDPAPELGDEAPKTVLKTSNSSAVLTAARRALARLYD